MVRVKYTVKMNNITTVSTSGTTDIAGLNTIIKRDMGAYVTHLKHEIGDGHYVDVEVFANGTLVYSVVK